MAETILSAGIDIGTTTTQLIFSRLTMEKTGGYGSAPKLEVISREVYYRSDIYFTPLLEDDSIDASGVAQIIMHEYEKAGVKPEELSTGAVIITGETAKRRNAKEVTEAISELAGDFVVAAAGPDLESVLAGKGAGADSLSENTGRPVLNIDIGGGTSNFCLFEEGEVIDTACYDIGGRMIEVDKSGVVKRMTTKAKKLVDELGLFIAPGERLDEKSADAFADYVANILAKASGLSDCRLNENEKLFETNHSLIKGRKPEIISFSGGVADCIPQKKECCKKASAELTAGKLTAGEIVAGKLTAGEITTSKKLFFNDEDDKYKFGDIGILLGHAIARNKYFNSITVAAAEETVRATVIGAGNCSMEVSGSTIFCRGAQFPMKNLPVFYMEASTDEQIDIVPELLSNIDLIKTESWNGGFVIAMTGPECPSYKQVERLGIIISQFLRTQKCIVPIVVKNDFSKALGHAIYRRIKDERPVVCLDSVECKTNDFIDIGKPVGDGIALPVIVKTLVFG